MSEGPSAMVSYAMRTAQNSPKAARVGVAGHHDILAWGTPHVLRVRADYAHEYDTVLLRSACPRPDGICLQFRDAMPRFESCLSMVPAVDLLVLDEPINLRWCLRRVPRRHGHATAANTAASERLAGMLWDVAISLDNPLIGIDMLVRLFVNINAVPPSHIIFLCDDAQLRETVAGVPTDKWGLRAIDPDNMASYKSLLHLKAKDMIKALRKRCEALKNTTYSFALDWEHRGLARGE